MAISLTQSVKVTGQSVSSVTTAGITTTSGDLVILNFSNASSVLSSLSDNKSNSYTSFSHAEVQHVSNVNARAGEAYNANITGGASHTFTYTSTGTGTLLTLHARVVQGHASSPLDKTAAYNSATNATSFTTATTATLAQANNLVTGWASSFGSLVANYTKGASYTENQNTSNTATTFGLLTASKVVAATTGVFFDWTTAATDRGFGGVSVWKEAAAVGARQQTLTLLGVGA